MTAASASGHATVLLQEAVDALVTSTDGFYIDGTCGRGGHSREILRRLSERGRLLAIDKDPEACAAVRQAFENDHRFTIERGSFTEMRQKVQAHQHLGRVSGVLLDLGVSSPQLDAAERGFSFMRDGPLDMRMDPTSGVSAAQWLAEAGEDEIARVLKEYGEERYSRRIARALVSARAEAPIETTARLAEIVSAANPSRERNKHPGTRTFQAIRIHINRELDELRQALDSVLDVLAVGGRLVVIGFHSLEIRMVKRFIRANEHVAVPKGLPLRDSEIRRRLRGIGGAIKPGATEIDNNPRARSAVMRVAEKVA